MKVKEAIEILNGFTDEQKELPLLISTRTNSYLSPVETKAIARFDGHVILFDEKFSCGTAECDINAVRSFRSGVYKS